MENCEKKTFTAAEIKDIRAAIAKLKPANPVRTDGKTPIKGVIMKLAPALAKKKAQGCTNAELAAELGKKGLSVKPTTLGKYINAAMKTETVPETKEQPVIAQPSEQGMPF